MTMEKIAELLVDGHAIVRDGLELCAMESLRLPASEGDDESGNRALRRLRGSGLSFDE
jgi:hypothetical protein